MTEERIIALYWARDEQAITVTDAHYGKLCRSLSYNIVNDWEDAEECTNDTWHRAWNTMPPQRPSSLRAYLCRIVRNLSIDRWRPRGAKNGARDWMFFWRSWNPVCPADQAPRRKWRGCS